MPFLGQVKIIVCFVDLPLYICIEVKKYLNTISAWLLVIFFIMNTNYVI